MTQKEFRIIRAVETNCTDNECWGIWRASNSLEAHGTVENVDIPYPHIYVYRETEDDENPRLNFGPNADFPDPDLTLEAANGQIIDFYYIKMED